MPKIDIDAIPEISITGYPPPYDREVRGRSWRPLNQPGGLTDFVANHVTLLPGAWSSQRHWHEGEDEFLVLVSGDAVLVDDRGRTPLGPGDCAVFPKGDGNGHCLVNEGDAPCVFVVMGLPEKTDCHYPDIDLHVDGPTQQYTRKDGTRY
ncbi:MAG: cupin domain-containing protein [Alphaproteobacteria bacterium]|nr:MAG: cupin domain-containing protein [Alphaproteobacteria bacterium]